MTAPRSTTTVEGATTLVASLGELERDLEGLAPPQAGTFIRDQARARAPYQSGALRSSLAAETDNGQVTVHSGLIYAGVIHHGWAAHNIAANPFLTSAVEDTENAWGAIYQTEVSRVIREDVRGA